MANGNDRLVFSRKYLASSYAHIEIFMSFDPIAATEAAKNTRALRKGKNYKKRTSKLEPFRSEIAKMYKTGASLELISLHLHTVHNQYAARSTILRYLHTIGVTRNG
ncbi:hypothetical protein KW429_22995 [Vibrio fluvialis]|jgi:hypothetical protein|nr:hypothetical protein [Vibrio fluvialis]MBY8186568.1 hypothetical protein [Vibrio fluvialis]